ncbi:hypothetical protein EV359DRAFT_59716 [Lentinula novae-zelandiae]|nr:hypothetical protein EV359DRAFT_59716 [Lentinula novae-zelandiae]
MGEQLSQRYYALTQYLLPADDVETRRLNAQHNIITNAFGGKLSVAPTNLATGDRVLESAAGSGIWALEFFETNRADGITLDIECIDISSEQFPTTHPLEIKFSVNSVVNLPNPEWTERFSFAHQRLLVAAMNNSLWHLAVAELFRVVKPGAWVELVEIEAQGFGSWSVGPHSTKLAFLINTMYDKRGVIGDLSVYLPLILKEAGFVDIKCEARHAPIGGEADAAAPHKFTQVKGFDSEMWRELWKGMKVPVIEAGGYGIVKTVEEYDSLVQGSAAEWKTSNEAYTTFYAILARKPSIEDLSA